MFTCGNLPLNKTGLGHRNKTPLETGDTLFDEHWHIPTFFSLITFLCSEQVGKRATFLFASLALLKSIFFEPCYSE